MPDVVSKISKEELRTLIRTGANVYGVVRLYRCDCGEADCQTIRTQILFASAIDQPPAHITPTPGLIRTVAEVVSEPLINAIRVDLSEDLRVPLMAAPTANAPGKPLVN